MKRLLFVLLITSIVMMGCSKDKDNDTSLSETLWSCSNEGIRTDVLFTSSSECTFTTHLLIPHVSEYTYKYNPPNIILIPKDPEKSARFEGTIEDRSMYIVNMSRPDVQLTLERQY